MLLKETEKRGNLDKQATNNICKRHFRKLLQTNDTLEDTFDSLLNS